MRYGFIFTYLFLISIIANANTKDENDFGSRYLYIHSEYVVNDDATHTEKHEWAEKILKERAIEYAKETSISYSTSIQKAEILSAYTLKADGRRINAPKTNFQVHTNFGKDKNAPVFSDRTRLTVVFPEVQVGDTVVFSYKLTQKEALFPGQFTASKTYSKEYPYGDVRVILDLPESFPGHYKVRSMSEKVSHQNGRKRITLAYENKNPVKITRHNFSVWDMESEPGFIYSTFSNYKQVAKAYGKRAIPKAKPSTRVIKLANNIVGDERQKREQARLLYEWVATNITYAGNCIGVGAVVPHDLDFILDNRMGDCKDHATLLQALLAVRGINSTQALINAGSVYKLPSLPLVSSVNHVINYLPQFDMFLDSTSRDTPFGMLPFQDIDKPVLLVEGYIKGLKTPVPPVGNNRQIMKMIVKIKTDGSANGEINVKQKGTFAVSSRAWLRNMSKKDEEDFLKRVFDREGSQGTGSWKKDDPTALLDDFSYKVKFTKKDFINRPGAGALTVFPVFPTEASVYRFVASAVSPIEKEDISCSNGVSEEEYTYLLPKTMTILVKPDDVEFKSRYLDYSSSYTFKNHKLTIKRIVNDKAPGGICSPKVMKVQHMVGLKAIKNLKSQVIYQ